MLWGGFANRGSCLRSFLTMFSAVIHVYNCLLVGYPKMRIVSETEFVW